MYRRKLLLPTLALLPLAACGQPTFVGDSGTMEDESGRLTVFVNTCGEEIEGVTVASDGTTIAEYTPAEPASGAFTFVLGDPAPSEPVSWDVSEVGTATTDPDSKITVTPELSDADSNTQFRNAESTRSRISDSAGQIVVGKPHKSGDQTLAYPQDWEEICRTTEPPSSSAPPS